MSTYGRGSVVVSVTRVGDLRVTLWSDLRGGRRVATRVTLDAWPDSGEGPTAEEVMTTGERGPSLRNPPAVPGQDGITTAVLRSVPLASLLKEQAADAGLIASLPSEAVAIFSSILGGRLATFTDADMRAYPYLADAVAYVQAVRAGSVRPAVALSESTGRPLPSVHTRLVKARRLGLLLPAGRGKVGGALSPLALRLLRQSAESARPKERAALMALADELDDGQATGPQRPPEGARTPSGRKAPSETETGGRRFTRPAAPPSDSIEEE